MGRKLPKTSRHKKVKSLSGVTPLAQRSDAKDPVLARLKSEKFAAQSGSRDFQYLLEEGKADKKSKRKRRKIKDGESEVIEGFRRNPHESDHQFLYRVNLETNEFVEEKLMKAKFDIVAATTTPADVEEEKIEENSDDDDMPIPSKKPSTSGPPVFKGNRKRKKRGAKEMDLLNRHEKIPFGQTVDMPPTITAKLRKTEANGPRAGWGELRLGNLLQQPVESRLTLGLSAEKPYETDRTIKSADRHRQVELTAERSRVINAYRQQNKLKSKQT